MSENTPTPLSEPVLNHVKFFIFYTLCYFLAENFVKAMNNLFPTLLTPLVQVLGDLTITIFVVLFFLIFARLILLLLPELAISTAVPLYVALVPPVILSHPFLISVTGSHLTASWLLLNIIEEGQFFQWLLELVLFLFSGYAILAIQSRVPVKESRLNQILRYLGKDIFLILFIVVVSFDILQSYIQEDYSSVTLTLPVKLVLMFLFYIFTTPIIEESSSA